MPSDYEQLKSRVNTLERLLREFSSAPELDPQIKRTIAQVSGAPSDKTAGSATQSVSEAGSSSYNVMKAPTGFITVGGYNVPYIT